MQPDLRRVDAINGDEAVGHLVQTEQRKHERTLARASTTTNLRTTTAIYPQ
jgi:hypothetical protein